MGKWGVEGGGEVEGWGSEEVMEMANEMGFGDRQIPSHFYIGAGEPLFQEVIWKPS